MVNGISDGVAVINMMSQAGVPLQSRSIAVNSDIVQLYDSGARDPLDAIVSFLQVFVDQPSSTRYEPSVVRLQVTPGLFFARAMVNITVSAVLDDGSRLLLTDPAELNITSKNESIVRAENLTLVAISAGSGELIVIEWIVCDQILANTTAFVTVAFDDNRPTFTPSQGNTSVPEDYPAGEIVYTVTAIDRDALDDQSVHANIEYALQTGSDHDGLFIIDKITGDIILTRSLDREMQDRYIVHIEATDARQRMLMAEMNQGGSGSGNFDIDPPDVFTVSNLQVQFKFPEYICTHKRFVKHV